MTDLGRLLILLGAVLVVDIAHVAGLVAVGLSPSPVPVEDPCAALMVAPTAPVSGASAMVAWPLALIVLPPSAIVTPTA